MLNDNPALRGKGSKRKKPRQNPMEETKTKSEPKPKAKRKYKLHLRVPVEAEEGEVIKDQAEKCGLSAAEYLRRLGLGYEPTSIVDNQKVNELAKINGDLGRLGGLLKLWLSDDRRSAHFDKKTINGLLKDIERTRTQMTEIMMKVIHSKK
ncbi:conjugal transfer transcriptional regulator TraJ [Nitrosomonas sp. Nm84]|uniref:conjugal transfer transcriptional regulator TraJ n=1 Tax=Nitrosomonas sp. Nm84 TaxID=200124 RepID=UPI001A9F5F49|nr:conjugal transfer transcriptional regulator TraJ [Nitrosomonas sp. Nm84]